MADKKRKPSLFKAPIEDQVRLSRSMMQDELDRMFSLGREYKTVQDIDRMQGGINKRQRDAIKKAGYSGRPKISPARRTETGRPAMRMGYDPLLISGYTPITRKGIYKPPARRISGKSSGMAGMGAGLGIGQMLRGMMNKEQPKR